MRGKVILFCWLATLMTSAAVTPEVGKEKLRKLVKLPVLLFAADWTFDVERGFVLGSDREDKLARIAELRKGIKQDMGDAEAFQAIGEIYDSLNEKDAAKVAYVQAAGWYRKRLEYQPDDGVLMAQMGLSLQGAGHPAEAESLLRNAVRTAPREWKCRLALGRFLDSAARRVVLDVPLPPPLADGTVSDPEPVKLTADQVALARRQMDEAGKCLDQAASLAPKEADVLLRRGLHVCLRQAVLNKIGESTGAHEAAVNPLDGCFTVDSLRDLQKASSLRPDDYRLMGATVLFEIYTDCGRKGQIEWDKFTWNSLPDQSQRSVREAMARLGELTQSADKHAAAGASEVLGILQGPVLHEPDACIVNLKRALALQPERQQAWEILVATLAQTGRLDELLSTCEDLVKEQDTSRAHLLLAKAHEKLKQWDDCEDEARIAALRNPNDYAADLAVAALLLKRSREDTDALAEANQWLGKAESALNKLPRRLRNRQQVVDLTLTRGIFFALVDEMDTARQWVKAVVDREQDNKFAQEVLAAMDF